MKKFLIILLTAILSFGVSSCASTQTVEIEYPRVYFDHVVYGFVDGDNYIYDGTYSYHILGVAPENLYWELTPLSWDVYVYTKQMVRLGIYRYEKRHIFYGYNHYELNLDHKHKRLFARPRHHHNIGKVPMVERRVFKLRPRPMDRHIGRPFGNPRPPRQLPPPKRGKR